MPAERLESTTTLVSRPGDDREDVRGEDVAEALLGASLSAGVASATLRRRVTGYELEVTRGEVGTVLGTVSMDMGAAAVRRLLEIAGVTGPVDGEHHARRHIQHGGGRAEVLLSFLGGGEAERVEARRLGGAVVATLAPRATLPDLGGATRFGSYVPVGELGRGGGGVVLEAQHELLGWRVAVKTLDPRIARRSSSRRAFLEEARAASCVRHPGVVQLLDFGYASNGLPYLVMELVDAPTLEAVLDAGPLAPARALRVARDVCVPLETVHEAGLVHCDIKPGNIFVGARGRVQIADFGAVRLLDRGRRSGSGRLLIGTPAYLAPELATGEPATEQTDIYALGCVLYHAIAGHPPFVGEDIPRVLRAHRDEAPALEPIPEAVRPVVARALAKAPGERYESAPHLRTALADALRDLERP